MRSKRAVRSAAKDMPDGTQAGDAHRSTAARKPSDSNRPWRVVARKRPVLPAEDGAVVADDPGLDVAAADPAVVDAVARRPARRRPRRPGGRAPCPARTRSAAAASPSPSTDPGGPSTPPRVGDRRPDHLGPRAHGHHRAPHASTAAARPDDAEPVQVGPGVLRPGQHHQVGPPEGRRRPHPAHRHARLQPQRVEVAEVGDPGEADDGHVDDRAVAGPRCPTSRAPASPRRRCRCRGRRGTTPSTGTPVRRSSSAQASPSSDGSPRKRLITNPRTHARRSSGSSAHVPNSEANTPPRSMSPTTTDRQPGRRGQGHVGEVARQQVDLGRPARPLADHHVVPRPQVGQRGQHRRPQRRLASRGSRPPTARPSARPSPPPGSSARRSA